jgi:hypothetical protein
MRIASMTLGILGGIIAFTLSLLLLMGGISFLNAGMWEYMYDSSGELQDIMPESEFIQQNASAGTVFLATGICSAVAGILGLTGGINRQEKACGRRGNDDHSGCAQPVWFSQCFIHDIVDIGRRVCADTGFPD